MILNALELKNSQQELIARNVSLLSQGKNSSLLKKEYADVIDVIMQGMMYVYVHKSKPAFITAFEHTGNEKFYEVGVTCNLLPTQVRGKNIFPLLIDHYRQNNGNGSHVLYLTTTNIRMARVAQVSGFTRMDIGQKLLPLDVVHFCCNPCPIEKTGVREVGQQLDACKRYRGLYIPQDGEDCTRIPCMIFIQKITE